MMAKVSSVTLVGMDAKRVDVEVHLEPGLPDFQIVGLPSEAIRESRRRVRAAIVSTNRSFPKKKITANLAPSDLRKEGALLDLPLAVGLLAANGDLAKRDGTDLESPLARLGSYVFVGELSLDGRLRPVRGVLAAALATRKAGAEGLVVPRENAVEAALVPGVKVVGASHLLEAMAFATGELEPSSSPVDVDAFLAVATAGVPDLSDVRGQALARRALEIAAVGGHNLLMVGPPGAGKTMLARRLPGILPPMSREEALEVTHVWSVTGLLREGEPLVASRPFRSPHHQSSAAAVIGGGSPNARPGEVSLAHHGVLFLDEFPYFSRSVLEALRQPMEDRVVTVARKGGSFTFPAGFCLIAAANPCPCGKSGERTASCSCPPGRFFAYRSKLSGPLLDRIDLHVEVARLEEEELADMTPGESTSAVRNRVLRAREFRHRRTSSDGGETFEDGARELLVRSAVALGGSARSYDKLARVARTIADLGVAAAVEEDHVAEALQFRRKVWEQ